MEPVCCPALLLQVDRESDRFSVALKQSLCGSKDAAYLRSLFRWAGSGRGCCCARCAGWGQVAGAGWPFSSGAGGQAAWVSSRH